jgi:hypothetical protein
MNRLALKAPTVVGPPFVDARGARPDSRYVLADAGGMGISRLAR